MTTTTPTKPLKRLSLLQSPTSTTFVSPPSSNLGSPIVASERIITPERSGDANVTSAVRPQSSPTSQPSPVANTHSVSRSKSARRQSSIYYVPSDRGFERVTQGLDSPVNARRFSALQGNTKPQGDRIRRDVSPTDSSGAATASLTLAERHADLLRFIAQKESKCLELRSQLATHEAELLALKRKWERIVSRGLGGGLSASLSSFDADASPQAAVFTGIREGMQGMGRLLAQIGDLSSQGADMNNTNSESGHMSNSSVSTSLTSSSTRLSQSSISSLGIPDDEASEKCEELPRDAQATRREPFSISTAVRRKPYEPSSPLAPQSSLPTSKSPLFAPSPKLVSPSPMSPRLHSTPQTLTKYRERHSATQGTFPSASSIPGVSTGAPLASWVDSVGKKLGQIHAQVGAPGAGAQPIHKRASTLLSDASYSLFAALASPTRPAAPPYAGEQKSPLSAKSLLDDDDDALGEWAGMAALSPDLPKVAPARIAPSMVAAPISSAKSQDSVQKSSDADSDEWNW